MLFVLLCFIIGALAGSCTMVSPWIFLGGAALIAAIVFFLFKPDLYIFLPCLAAFIFTLFRMAAICAADFPDPHAARFCSGHTHKILCIVRSLPQIYSNKTRYTVDCTHINTRTALGRLRLSVYHDMSKQPGPCLLFGEHIVVASKIRVARNFSNPGGYDYEFRMRLKGLTGSIYTNGDQIVHTGQMDNRLSARLMRLLQRTRTRFAGHVAKAVHTADCGQPDFFTGQAGAVLTALVTGQKQMIAQDTRDHFSKAGLSHILAVSGLHMSLVGLGFFTVFICLFNPWPNFVITGWAKKTAGVLTLLPLTAYAFFAGFSPSTQRALIMTAVFLTAYFMEKQTDPLNSLYLAASLILLHDPGALFSISFQLSFACVFFIICGFKFWANAFGLPENKWIKRICLMMMTTLFAAIGATPVTAFYFNMFSMIQVAANLAMVPVIGFLCLPLGFAGLICMDVAPFLTRIFLTADIHILCSCLKAIHWITGFDWTWARVVTPRPLEIIIYYALILCLGFAVIKKRKSFIYLAFVLTVAGTVSIGHGMFKRFNPGKLVVHTLDVGQGNAALVMTPGGKTLLVDAGGFSGSSAFDTGRNIVGPFLWQNWILTLDCVILTHPDCDHMNGLNFIFDNFRVEQWIQNGDKSLSHHFKNLVRTARQKGINTHVPGPDPSRLSWDQVKITVIGPGQGDGTAAGDNNNSLVTRIDFLSFSMLFAGDIEKNREKELVQATNFRLKSDILMAPHHGSCSSSSKIFLDQVRPSGVIISCGYLNRYKFPCRSVLQLYRRNKISIFRTDVMGAVTLQSDGFNYTIKTHRNL